MSQMSSKSTLTLSEGEADSCEAAESRENIILLKNKEAGDSCGRGPQPRGWRRPVFTCGDYGALVVAMSI